VVILSLILSVIAIVVGIIALFATSMIISKLIEKNYFPNPAETPKSDTEIPEYDRGFADGRNSTWYAVQLSLFSMFKDADIYDYEGSVENLQKLLIKIIEDPKLSETLIDDLAEYTKGRDNDSNDY
jgi:hypothetical protein